MSAYTRLPISFTKGQGCILWDRDNVQYLDAIGGIAVTFLGHCHPKISQAISLQATKLLHVSNLFHIQEQAQLGERFCAIAGMDKVFFSNSGAEANELAIKIARLHGRSQGIKTPTIITANNSFHGRTMATLSATGNTNVKKGFEPLVAEFKHVAYNDLAAFDQHKSNKDIVAIMIEPIQGEGGIQVPDTNYLSALRKLCDDQGWLLIIDEIQSGMGRTGKWFCYQHDDIVPDVMTSAKALGNGIPIGACAASGAAADLISPGSHGTTFGGNPFASQVALTVIDIIEQENLVEQAAIIGSYLKKQLQQHLCTLEKVVDIRGRGLMLGIELDDAYPNLAKHFLAAGLIANITGDGKVIRLLPSVLLTEKQAKKIAEILRDVLTAL